MDEMQGLFDAACHGELKMTMTTDFDERSMPIFQVTIEWDYSSHSGYRKCVEVDSFDGPQEAIFEALKLYRQESTY